MASHSTSLYSRLPVGSILNRSFDIYFKRAFFPLVGVIIFLCWVLIWYTYDQYLVDDIVTKASTGQIESDESAIYVEMARVFASHIFTVGLELLFEGWLGVLAQAAVAIAVAQYYAGRRVELLGSFQKVIQNFYSVLVTSLIATAASVLIVAFFGGIAIWTFSSTNDSLTPIGLVSVLVGLVAYVYITVTLMILTPIVMIEKLRPKEALKRCWSLAENSRFEIFCARWMFNFIFGVISRVLNTGVAAFATGDPANFFSLTSVIIVQSPTIVSAPTWAILATVCYLNIRVTREGLNQEVLEGNLDEGSTPQYSMVDLDAIESPEYRSPISSEGAETANPKSKEEAELVEGELVEGELV